jgi:carbonic anhydrase
MPMSTVDYIYRFDPKHEEDEPVPQTPAEARSKLNRGNALFTDWIESCRTSRFSVGEPRYVINCNHLDEVMDWDSGAVPRHQPFAIALGCSDARVPVEMVFGQSLSELFVVRVAGNILDAVAQGSIDYALANLSKQMRAMVVLGHIGCGAVGAAVDAYLRPEMYWEDSTSHSIRSILRRLVLTVHESAEILAQTHGAAVKEAPGYRLALNLLSVCLNAAHGSYDLARAVERQPTPVEVYFGVYNLYSGRVGLPLDYEAAKPWIMRPGLHDAPRYWSEIRALGKEIALSIAGTLDAPGVQVAVRGPTRPELSTG